MPGADWQGVWLVQEPSEEEFLAAQARLSKKKGGKVKQKA